MNRREFFYLAGLMATGAIGISCEKKRELYLPHVVPREQEIPPGELVYYPTTCTACPANCGVYARVVEKVYNNRRIQVPVKLEGNPKHPVNGGALCIRGQASIEALYSHDGGDQLDIVDRLYTRVTGQKRWRYPGNINRLTKPMMKKGTGEFVEVTWEEALAKIADSLKQADRSGKKSYLLSSRTTGTLSELMDLFCERQGVIRLPEFEPCSYSTLREADLLLFNQKAIPYYEIESADLLITLGVDLLETFVSPVSFARRIARAKEKDGFFWIHIEPHISITGASAHRRIVLKPMSEPILLMYVLKNLKRNLPGTKHLPEVTKERVAEITGLESEEIDFILKRINEARAPLVIPGGVSVECERGMDTAVLAGLLQFSSVYGGELLDFGRAENYDRTGSFREAKKFIENLEREGAGVVFLHNLDILSYIPDGHPLKKAELSVGMGEFMNSTLEACDIVLPLSDILESWGDAEPRKGVRSVIQPVTEVFFDTLSSGDIFLRLLGEVSPEFKKENYQSFLFKNWRRKGGERYLEALINEGVVEERTLRMPAKLKVNAVVEYLKRLKEPPIAVEKVGTLVVAPSLRLYDRRNSPIDLLSEIPDPLSTVSYGEWVGISEYSARALGLMDGDIVSITIDKESIQLPVKVQPGLSASIYYIQFPFLPERLIKINPAGDISRILQVDFLKKAGRKLALPVLSGGMFQQGRGIVYEEEHNESHVEEHKSHTLYPEPQHKIYRWAMVIDLELCTGCSACVAACYIENNVPVTGRELHLEGRELSWIRLEPFFDSGRAQLIPMLCQQCSYAPCESVCPVYATYHNPEGLNAQVYNRCVGTRYCSNNCPYKVRRFNWFNFRLEGFRALKYNPDVLVRPRGVMEKCTFCVQRIRRAKDRAKDEARLVKDGEVMPACAQTCPSGAITFGNILDKESKVYILANSERAYRVFEGLGTEPAVYYLRKKEKT